MVRDRRDPRAFIDAHRREMRSATVQRGIDMKRGDFMTFFTVSVRQGSKGGFTCLVLVSRSVREERGATGLSGGVRDRDHHGTDGGTLRNRGRRRQGQGTRGRSRNFHLQSKSQTENEDSEIKE